MNAISTFSPQAHGPSMRQTKTCPRFNEKIPRAMLSSFLDAAGRFSMVEDAPRTICASILLSCSYAGSWGGKLCTLLR